MKHRVSLQVCTRKLEENKLAQERAKHAQPTNSVLLPLPEMPWALSTGPNDGTLDVFENFRRSGLTYLDENGDRLEFSVGTELSDVGDRAQNRVDETVTPNPPDESESDVDDSLQPEWVAQDSGSDDYWPYPSKTVSWNL